jgi:ribonuclease HII
VVAAAVMFPPGTEFAGIDDSKRLDVEQRFKMESVIRRTATAVAIGLAEVGEIDRLNIYHAVLLTMRRAVDALAVKPDHLLIDAASYPAGLMDAHDVSTLVNSAK